MRSGEERKSSFACADMLNKRQPRVGTFLTEVQLQNHFKNNSSVSNQNTCIFIKLLKLLN